MEEPRASTKDWAKLGLIYKVLTDEDIRLWVSSEEDGTGGGLKLPRENITAAFRKAERDFEQLSGEAELEMNTDGCIAIPQLSEVLSELVFRVVGGTLPQDVAVKYLASEHPFEKRLGTAGGDANASDWRVPPAAEVLCDTLWGVDAMVRGSWTASKPDYVKNLKRNEQWNKLCSFVDSLKKQKLLPEKLLLSRLTEELLVCSGMILPPTLLKGKKSPTTVLSRTMLRKNTEMLYKQHRFNLLREETEGFAKLVVLLSGVTDSNRSQAEENLRRLIGYFDLDPNRSLDLTLDALEAGPSNQGLLHLVSRFSKDSLPHVVGLKLRHYRDPFVGKVHRARARDAFNKKEIDAVTYKERMDKVTPRSLYVAIAVLLATETLPLEGLLRHVSPGVASLAAKDSEYMEDLASQLSKAGSRVVHLDEDGRVTVGGTGSGGGLGGGANTGNTKRLASMGPLAPSFGYGLQGGLQGGSGSLAFRDRDRELREREAARERDRDIRRRSGDSSAGGTKTINVNSNSNRANAKEDGRDVLDDGDQEEEGAATGKDNQLYGVLEALLDLRAWKVASELLDRLWKEGVDAMRDRSVRTALKRLIGAALEGLASRFPTPVKLCPAGEKKAPPLPLPLPSMPMPMVTSSGDSNSNSRNPGTARGSSPVAEAPEDLEDMETEEAEAGEVIPQKRPPLRVASSQSNSFARPTPTLPAPAVDPRNNNSNTLKTAATAATATTVAADLDRLKRLPGYGSGFLASNQISEAVAVLGPYLKIFGPHLGRDPIMFARVCRVLSWVNAPNPLAMPTGASGSKSKTGSSNRSAMENQNQNAKNASNSSNDQSSSGDELAYLRGFRSLMGLSVREVQQVFDRPEAQLEKERRRTTSNSNSGSGRNNGNADLRGDPKGAAAVKRELDRRKAAYIRVVRTVAPALGMMRGNPAMQGEVWGMLENLGFDERFHVYEAWRGYGMEKQGLGFKHPQYVVAETASGAEISRLIKTLTSDNVRNMARKLGKSSHGHPLIFAEKVLNQLESYDNFITMVVDSMRFVGQALGLDCLAFTMMQHISQSNRRFVSESGLDLERWVGNLSTFAGLLYRKHPEADCQALLCWASRSLGQGGEAAMAAGKVLREVLHQAGGVQVLDGWSITQAQVDGKGGGDVMRQENASFGSTVKPLRNARKSLQESMEKTGVALSLLILPAVQKETLLHLGGSLDDQMRGKPIPHLKVLGHRSDETHTTMLQASEFVCSSKAWIRHKCPSIQVLVSVYKLPPRVAFHIWRPVINENLMKHWFPKPGTKTDKEQKEEIEATRFMEELEGLLHGLLPDSSLLTAKLLVVFWALSLSDVYIPTKKYAQVVTNMNEAKRRAETKLAQAERGEVTLTKAEKARYTSDKKTCPGLASKLEAEKATQSQHVKRVKSKLREIKTTLFTNGRHAETIQVILKHLVGPRLGMGPEEAYFCSKFFNTLHLIEAPQFNSLLFYCRSFEYLSPKLLGMSQYEAAGLGFFFKDLLENATEWRSGKSDAIYTMEAGTKHGFNLSIGTGTGVHDGTGTGLHDTEAEAEKGDGDVKGKSPQKAPQLTHKQFAETSGMWSVQVTKTLLAAFKSDEFLLIKSGLIMFNKIIETFPMSLRERKLLFQRLEPMTDKSKEPRDDIRVPCTRIVTQLKKQIAEAPPDPETHVEPLRQSGQQGSSTSGTVTAVPAKDAGANPSKKDGLDASSTLQSSASSSSSSRNVNNTPSSNVSNVSNNNNSVGQKGAKVATPPGGVGKQPSPPPLSVDAKPFVPKTSAPSSSSSSSKASPGSGGGSSAAPSSSKASPVKNELSVSVPTVPTGVSKVPTVSTKRTREAHTPSPSTTRPLKKPNVVPEQGEITPQTLKANAGSSSGGVGGAPTNAKPIGRDSKAAQSSATSPSSSSGSGTSNMSNNTSTTKQSGPRTGDSTSASKATASAPSTTSSSTPARTPTAGIASRPVPSRVPSGIQQQQQQQQQSQQGRGVGVGAGGRVVRDVRGRDRVGDGGVKVRDGEREVEVRIRTEEGQKIERLPARSVDISAGSTLRGTGTLAVGTTSRNSRDSRRVAGSGRVPLGESEEQHPSSSGIGSGGSRRNSDGRIPDGRDPDGREDLRSRIGGGVQVGRGHPGTGPRGERSWRSDPVDLPPRGGNSSGGGGGGGGERVDRGDRGDTWRDTRMAMAMPDSARGGGDRVGGGMGGDRSGGMGRGSKRGRSVDSDRGVGEQVYEDEGQERDRGGEVLGGDPSQAFDSTRMRQTNQPLPEPARPPVDGWGRGYDGGSRESPLGGSDGVGGRYRGGAVMEPRRVGGRVPLSPREASGSGSVYDGRGGRGGGRQVMTVEGGHMDGLGMQRDPRGRDQDGDLRAARGREPKKSRDRQRDSHSRDRKDRKKSKNKKRKH